MSSINASIPDYLNVGSKHDGCPLQWRQTLWKQSCELFKKTASSQSMGNANSLGRWTAKPIFPTIDMNFARGFASRDAAMNFASRHGDTWLNNVSNEMVQGWFAVVTMVQGLSQPCFWVPFFGNCCGQHWSRIETGCCLAVFFQSISGSACLSLGSLAIMFEDWVNYHDVSLISKNLPTKCVLLSRTFAGWDWKENSPFRQWESSLRLRWVVMFSSRRLELGLWFWDPSVCNSTAHAMWIFQCERSSNSPLISEWPKIIAIMP